MRIAVTGCASDFATVILPRLLDDPDVEEVIGVGRRNEPRVEHPKLRFEREDVRSPRMRELFAGCEAVCHLAFIAAEIHDKELTEDINFNGSVNVIEAAHAAGARRVVVASGASSYGAENGFPPFVDEDVFPRGRADKYYFRQSAEVEHFAEWWLRRRAADDTFAITLLRAPFISGPHVSNEGIDLMTAPVMIIAAGDGRFQLIHESDLADGFHRALKTDLVGAFNMAPADALSAHEVAAIHGQRVVTLPLGAASAAADVLFRLRLAPFSGEWVIPSEACMRSDRFRAATGWEPGLSSREAAHVMLLQRGRPIVESRGELRRSHVAEAVLAPLTEQLRVWSEDEPELTGGAGAAGLDEALGALEHVFLETGSGDLHLEVHAGDDPSARTYVLSPELGGHARFHTPLLGSLRAVGFNAIGIDRPGHGLSHGVRGDCPTDAGIAALERAIAYARARFTGPVTLCGSSVAGSVRSYLARHGPDAGLAVMSWPEADVAPRSQVHARLVTSLAAATPRAPVPLHWIVRPATLGAHTVGDPYRASQADRIWCWRLTARTAASAISESRLAPPGTATTHILDGDGAGGRVAHAALGGGAG